MFKRYKNNTDGNVAMMFGATALTLIIGLGAAVDFGSASNRQQDLQDMVDAATLAAARSKSTDLAELQAIVNSSVKEHNEDDHKITLDVTIVGNQVHVTGQTTYDTHIMGVVGRNHIDVAASAASPIAGLTPVKLALVLDNTESMSGADLIALQQASRSLLDELEDFEAPVAVSVVPFGQYVNVGTSRRHETWLDVSRDGTSETVENCFDEQETITPRQCTNTGRLISREVVRDGRSFGFEQVEERNCTRAERRNTGNRICEPRTTEYTWHGCVGSRQSPYNEQAAFNLNQIPGVMNETCGSEIQELSTSFTASRLAINNMVATGNTYLPSGLVWGWRTLQDELPLKTNVNLNVQDGLTLEAAKVMVFMTDGANTLSQGGDEPHLHNAAVRSKADARTRALCDGAKAEGIQIYTIGYRLQDATDDVRNVLLDCASTPSHNFDAANAAELNQAFKDLVGQLDFARLAF